MARRISIYPEHVEIKLNLPWEVAEAIVSDGPAIIKALSSALNERKMEAEAKSPIKRFEVAHGATEDDRWLKLSREAERRIRRLRDSESLTDAKAMSQIAHELDLPYSSLQAVLSKFRRDRRERLTARRNAQIIRLHFLGLPATDIGKRLKINAVTATRVLREEDDLIRSLGKFRNIARYRKPAVIEPISGVADNSGALTRKLREDELRELQAHHTRLGVQFYRQLRRLSFTNSERWWALKEIATPHGLHPDYVAQLISARKRKVRAYLKRRRGQTIVRLMGAGLMQKEIAKRFNVSATVIGKRYDAYLEMHRARPDLYPLPQKGSDDQ